MHQPATVPTMHFIGVTTGSSSIMQVFPAWAVELGLDAVIHGIDLPLDDTPAHYRDVVEFIKSDPRSLGAVVTTHKLNLYRAARDLFDGVDDGARILEEVSGISKRGAALWGHATDPEAGGLALQAIVGDGYWARTGADLVLLGAGGSSLALTLWLHERAVAGGDVPGRVIVTSRRPARLDEMLALHHTLGWTVPTEYLLAPSPEDNDRALALARPGSVVINATGLGKDRPGSPLSDAAVFPEGGVAWDFNYRGDLVFLSQALAQAAGRGLRVEDGWLYFIHGWTRVMAQVFHTAIPTTGPAFDRLCEIAARARRGGVIASRAGR